jgi:hypothetical protein
MQVHGVIDLRTDVDAIVLDPSFQATEVHQAVARVSDRYDVELEWHPGSELPVDQIPTDFRGPTMPEVGTRAARADGVVDARSIGVVARDTPLPEMRISGDPPESDAQQLKYLWHTLLALGSDASPTTQPPHRITRTTTGGPPGNGSSPAPRNHGTTSPRPGKSVVMPCRARLR